MVPAQGEITSYNLLFVERSHSYRHLAKQQTPAQASHPDVPHSIIAVNFAKVLTSQGERSRAL